MDDTLKQIRTQIDDVDDEIVRLFGKRIDLAMKVAQVKNAASTTPITDLSREESILHRLKQKTHHAYVKDEIDEIFPILFAQSKKVRYLHQVSRFPFRSVLIIGDGLLGRSLYDVICMKDTSVMVHIVNHTWDETEVRNVEFIIIATPINTVADIAHRLYKMVTPGTIVIDVASVKSHIADTFFKLNMQSEKILYVPTHPMGGKQTQGKEGASVTLFAGKPWIICENKDDDRYRKVEECIRFFGSQAIYLDAASHDRMVAFISHFPGMLSKWLFDFVSTYQSDALVLASSGFDMMTKIGKTQNTRMRSQIYDANQQNISSVLEIFTDYIQAHPNPW